MTKYERLFLVTAASVLGFAVGFFVPAIVVKSGIERSQPVQVVQDFDSLGIEKAREAELTLIRLDLNEYSHLSGAMRNRAINSLDSASRQYRIPVGFLHAIFRIESSYQFQIDHPKVSTKIYGKKTIIQAVGLGGVVWEIWADSLKKHGIANVRSDLYLPEVNIRASAYILRTITDNVLLNRQDKLSAPYSIIREIIRGYFGAYSTTYEARMMQITNELWLKRIAKDLIAS